MISRPNVKINLGLSILRRRPDGFHDLETLFVPCEDICDTLEIIPGDAFSETSAGLFSRYGGSGIAQAISPDGKVMITIARKEGVEWDPLKDLTLRAYYILADNFSLPPVKIFLEKNSPVGAGLGGGSADAAFALSMLSSMFGLNLGEKELASYASRLGSDCAFFVYNRPMFGEGRGEVLTPWTQALPGKIRIVVPEGISVSTAEAYRGIKPKENSQRKTSLSEALLSPVSEWKELIVNDFEETVFALHPALAGYKQKLYDEGALYAAMSGSGSALFGIFPV